MCLFAVATHSSYSCLENSMDGGGLWATVHGVAKSQTRLSNFTFTLFHFAVSFQDFIHFNCYLGHQHFHTSFSVRFFTYTVKFLVVRVLCYPGISVLSCPFFFFFFLYTVSFTLSAIGFDKCILSCSHHYSITQSRYIILKFLVSCIQPSLQWLLKTIDLMISP